MFLTENQLVNVRDFFLSPPIREDAAVGAAIDKIYVIVVFFAETDV